MPLSVPRVHLSLPVPLLSRWAVPVDAVLTLSAAADGPPRPPAAAHGAPPAAADLIGWLAAEAPIELVLDDPPTVLAVASPLLRTGLAEMLPAFAAGGDALAVCYGRHRFDLTDALDRALWRLVSARWTPRR
ncbi:hypothetical protein [Geodermatophilus sp. SYSU D00700]